MKALEFNVIQQEYTNQTEVEVTNLCNGFTARNIGDDTARVNGITLLPRLVPGTSGESVEISGNQGEIYRGRIQISFAGVGVAPRIEIVQKFYLSNQL